MTFRKITFIFIALLLSLLFLLQFWLIQNFTKDVSSKIGQAAFEVSRSTIETLIFRQSELQFKRIAFSSQISEQAQVEIINNLSSLSNEVDISLQDGQKDSFLTINSAGSSYKVDIPRTNIERSLDDMSNKILLSAISFIVLGLIAAGYFARKLSTPLKELQIASERVGRGDFGFQVPQTENLQSVELKNTVTAFNEMSTKIDLLQKENDKLQKQAQLSELAEITRGLAHTIRNPLNTLNLVIDELSCTENTQDKQQLNRVAKHQVQRIDKWVRSLMDIMSTDSNLIETVDLEKLIGSVIDELSINSNSKIKICLTLDSVNIKDNRYQLMAIQPELKSLLYSLINNAKEATEEFFRLPATSVKPIIDIQLKRVHKQLLINIIDQGGGFDPEVRRKLFSPHNTNKTYGSGMGLYLAHRIVTLKYNGDLTVEHNEPISNQRLAGSSIKITLNNRV